MDRNFPCGTHFGLILVNLYIKENSGVILGVEVAAGPREASEVARVESPSWALSNKRPELGGNGGFAAGRHIRWRCEVAGNVLRMHRFSLIMIVAGDRCY